MDSYVRLGSSQALEDMLDHRRRIARQLKFRSIGSGYDLGLVTTAIDKEIALIEEGIESVMDPQPAAEVGVVVQPNEAADPLIDTIVNLLKNPQEPRSGAVQVQGMQFPWSGEA